MDTLEERQHTGRVRGARPVSLAPRTVELGCEYVVPTRIYRAFQAGPAGDASRVATRDASDPGATGRG